MNTTPRALILFAVWLAALATLGFSIQRHLTVGADLRLFLPEPKTPEEKLLLNELGEGPGSRILIVALSNAGGAQLADTSRAMVAALSGNAEFRLVANGETSLDAIPDSLWPYRFLLTDAFDKEPLDETYLRKELLARERDFSSPAAAFLEPLLPRDPTLEVLKLIDRWQPTQQPQRRFDVWFDRKGERALLILETRAPAFDPDGQTTAIQLIHETFERVRKDNAMQIAVSGIGAFSMLMKNRTQGEAQNFGVAATVGMIVLLLIAYRRLDAVLLSALPLASAGLAGLAAVAFLFDAVHGITLAFGFTLIGVAQDYPLHLLSHQHAGTSSIEVARKLWPTLSTGVASTCIAYLTFYFSGVPGLAQLAAFTIAGLSVAGLTTRYLLPRLIRRHDVDYGQSRFLSLLNERLASFPRLTGLLTAAIFVTAAALILPRQPFWQNDLSTLTPVPPKLLQQDQALRDELGSADVRYLLVQSARNDADALVRLEALSGGLNELVNHGAIRGFDHIARYLPSEPLQKSRQQRLPSRSELHTALGKSLAGLSFRDDVFDPFLDDVNRAKELPALTVADLRDTPLAARTEMLLANSENGVFAFITLSGVQKPQAVEEYAKSSGNDLLFLDLKSASEGLVIRQRMWILWSLGAASALLVAVIAIALRNSKRVFTVLAPMALTTLFTLAILHGAGISLSLFHLISLVLCAGLGLDYALFFEHAAHDPAEQRRTLHAVLLCSGSTLMVFALLMLSTVPVLRAIGLTVTLGVIGNFALAFLLTRPTRQIAHA